MFVLTTSETLATFVDCPAQLGDVKGMLRWAQDEDGRLYSAKRLWHGGALVRLANELIYYLIAEHNKLPLPYCSKLNICGEFYWGAEYKRGREALTKSGEEPASDILARIEKTLQDNECERARYVASVFLDVALLNSDRPAWNILSTEAPCGSLSFYYYDHDRSLGWLGDGGRPDLIEIKSPPNEFDRIKRYTLFESTYHCARKLSDKSQRKAIFDSLVLEPELMAKISPQVPKSWMTDAEFETTQNATIAWWNFLKRQDYGKLDHSIFG